MFVALTIIAVTVAVAGSFSLGWLAHARSSGQ
jgi:hypothetical protein